MVGVGGRGSCLLGGRRCCSSGGYGFVGVRYCGGNGVGGHRLLFLGVFTHRYRK